jgi:Glyoxalase-like domain
MSTRFQVTIDCAQPEVLTRFWASALGYRVEDPPKGFETWTDYWRSIGVPEDELGPGDNADSLVDPDGVSPRIWFQVVPEGKVVKNRVHLDLDVGGGRDVPVATRRERVLAETARLEAAGATRAARVGAPEAAVDHFGMTMLDPEGNEFCLH